MPPYIVYKGKIAEMSPEIGDWNARTSAQNSAVRAIGITGVNFKTPNWSSELASKGLKLIDKKEDADKLVKEYKDEQAAIAAEEKRQTELDAIASKIKNLGSSGQYDVAAAKTPAQNEAITALSAKNNFGSTELSGKVNFQVSDDQIANDYNNSRLSTLRNIADKGNAQIAGITERLNSAQTLINQLPEGDSRRTSSEAYIKQLKSDLSSVQSAVVEADSKIKDFKPIKIGSPEAASQITSFREYLQLPEERASQQLRQIDPESYQTSIELGKKYREMAAAPIGETKSAQADQLRTNLVQEAINQLALGSQLGAEEQRQYQQAARAAQTARGNIFGVAPAVEEAVTTGLAGEQRKLARYGAAQQFLASGQNTSDALKADIAFRDALLQNRLGAASGFVAGGPSVYNLGQARTAQQQGAMQQYIQANQALPGGFNQQPSTASNFYQTTSPEIPVALTNAFNQLYRSQADYGASTYGAQVGAISRQPSGFQNFATAAGGAFDLARGFGALGSAGLICWVAREVYGIDNPKWLQFREWMLTKASDNLRNYYIEYGERIAKSIRNKPKIKALIRKWMDSKIG